jgi:VanZ family protein
MRLTVWTRLWLWVPPAMYMALIFHFSSQSEPLPELTEHVWDKLLHTVEYVGLAILWCRALSREGIGLRRAAILTVLIVSAYGASDEWHQLFVPMRSSDLYDWLTDTLAGAIGASLFVAASTLLRRRRRLRR